MTLDLVSVALGFVSAYVFYTVRSRHDAKKERDRALDQLLSDVAIRCIARPTNVRSN